jgi:hypothetical protein
MDGKFRSRKFALTIAALIMSSIFLAVGKLAGSEWVTVTIFILGLYGAANVVEKKNEH